jgi:hypothetical protein
LLKFSVNCRRRRAPFDEEAFRNRSAPRLDPRNRSGKKVFGEPVAVLLGLEQLGDQSMPAGRLISDKHSALRSPS